MAKVSYDPKPHDLPNRTTVLGYSFEGGDSIDVPEGISLGKFRAWQTYHPELGFTVEDASPAKPTNQDGLVAIHRGRGVFAVVQDGVVLDKLDPMSKAEADAFNALSDEDKAAFVDKPAAEVAAATATTATQPQTQTGQQ